MRRTRTRGRRAAAGDGLRPVAAEQADTLLVAGETEATETLTSVRAIRSFVRGRRRRSWVDLYAVGFAIVIGLIYLSDLLTAPLSRLGGAAGRATAQAAGQAASQAASQAVAGSALVIGIAAGLLMLAQAFGPIALSPTDSFWLLLSPLDRRALLRRPAATVAGLGALAGVTGGVLALAMAGPYLRHGPRALPAAWVALSAVSGAGLFLTVVFAAALAQPRERWRNRLRACCGAVAAIAVVGAVAGERWTALAHAITAGFARTSTGTLGVLAAVSVVLAALAGVLVWRSLRSFPAGVLRTDSARAGRALLAAAFLNVPLLTWIAEDNYWRGRLLPSRPWPNMPPAMALAWADWRRLGRRPALLAVLAASTLVPALAGAAITGKPHGAAIAIALLAGAIVAGLHGTATTRRDTNDQALRRMLGIDAASALMARAVLPALLAAAWLALALTVLVATGVLHGWLWPLLGLVAGPGAAAASLRMARTAPLNPADQGPNTAMGTTPPWMISRLLSVVVGLIGTYPMLRAAGTGQLHSGTFVAQIVLSAIVLGGYLFIASNVSPLSPAKDRAASGRHSVAFHRPTRLTVVIIGVVSTDCRPGRSASRVVR